MCTHIMSGPKMVPLISVGRPDYAWDTGIAESMLDLMEVRMHVSLSHSVLCFVLNFSHTQTRTPNTVFCIDVTRGAHDRITYVYARGLCFPVLSFPVSSVALPVCVHVSLRYGTASASLIVW